MKTTLKAFFVITILVLSSFYFSPSKSDNIIELHKQKDTVEHIISNAVKENKTPVLYFYADWCGSCKRFKKSLKSKLLKEALKNTILIKINVDKEGQGLQEKFGINAIPAFIKVNESGDLIAKITSAEWDEDIPENIAPIIDKLVNKNGYDQK
jgi:thioredoxin 1